MPKYVQHDGERWRVTSEDAFDGITGYVLSRGKRALWARVSDCIPDDKPRVRRLRDAGYILEFTDRGEVTLRQRGRRKRYTTSLAVLFGMTVKAAVDKEKSLKAFARSKGKVSRRGLR